MSQIQAKILLVEDEVEAAEMLASFLKLNGFQVFVAHEGKKALELIETHRNEIELAILDIMVPFVDGKQLCSRIRKDEVLHDIPVIFLTAKDKERDEIEGLNLGADDYISKPAGLNLVLAHVKTLLRRKGVQTNPDDKKIQYGKVCIHPDHSEVKVDGKRVDVTATEFQLLKLFFTNPKRIFSRQDILLQIMPEDHYVYDRTIDVHIKNLRIKLGEHGEIIKTYRGLGYGVNKDMAGL
ncbi:response regulator transcription factor [bacterium]|nr:MAG: response regulator transcription factor [bacterium]